MIISHCLICNQGSFWSSFAFVLQIFRSVSLHPSRRHSFYFHFLELASAGDFHYSLVGCNQIRQFLNFHWLEGAHLCLYFSVIFEVFKRGSTQLLITAIQAQMQTHSY
jgi:hypothetical protein